MAHTIVNLDNLKAVQAGIIYSARYYASATPTAIDNGHIVTLGILDTNEREVFVANAVSDATADKVYLVTTPEVMYKVDEIGLENFYNVASDEIRLHPLEVGDIFQVTTDAITGTPVVGEYLISANSSTGYTTSATIGSTVFSAQVLESTKLGYNKISAIRMRVVKA